MIFGDFVLILVKFLKIVRRNITCLWRYSNFISFHHIIHRCSISFSLPLNSQTSPAMPRKPMAYIMTSKAGLNGHEHLNIWWQLVTCVFKKTRVRNILAWYDQRNKEVCCLVLLGNCACVLWEFVTSGSHDLWSPVDFFTSWNNQLFNPMTPNHQNRWLEMTNLLPMSFMSSQSSIRWCCATRGEGEFRDGCLTKNTRVLMSWICPPWQGSHILWDIHKKKTQPFQFFHI